MAQWHSIECLLADDTLWRIEITEHTSLRLKTRWCPAALAAKFVTRLDGFCAADWMLQYLNVSGQKWASWSTRNIYSPPARWGLLDLIILFSSSSSPILFASSGSQWAPLDFNRQGPSAVSTAGPQPPGSKRSEHRWTPTAKQNARTKKCSKICAR